MISGSSQARDELATTTYTDNKCLNLGATTGAHLDNLSGTTSDRLNYTSLDMIVSKLSSTWLGGILVICVLASSQILKHICFDDVG